ncbi:MAG: DUF47 family protein [Deltaproteobacteria bacterium]|nr:DUF47 family protein [Deltaproteobacteria bacterium]
MNPINLLKKYILPEEINFFQELCEQAEATRNTLDDLYRCFVAGKESSCQAILADEHHAGALKERNMNDLGRAFLTPVDREAIFRVITHLDWIVISVKHLVMETKAYEIADLREYKNILIQLRNCADLLCQGFSALEKKDMERTGLKSDQTRDLAHKVTETYVLAMAKVAQGEDIHLMFKHKEILSQIKSIAKRFHVAANTLQDITMKLS